jgi:integrase
VTHLRQAMLEELQRRNYAKTTIQYYIQAVERFATHFHRPPDQLNQTHLREYQAYLLRERKLGPRTVKLHVSALRFFFVKTLKRSYLLEDMPYPKVPRRLPAILTTDEVTGLIDGARNLTDRTLLMVLYSTGMRNAELRLQVHDIDSRRMLIHISTGRAVAIAMSPSARRCWRRSACTTAGCGRRHGCSPARSRTGGPTNPSRPRSCGRPVASPPHAPSCRNGFRPTSCVIRTRRTWWKRARTCAPSSCCSAT